MEHTTLPLVLLLTLSASPLLGSDDYDFTYSTAPYVPLAAPTVVVANDEFNGDYRIVPIGFDFQYWDMGTTVVQFNTHGYCVFGVSAQYGMYPFNAGLVGLADSHVGYEQDESGGIGHRILKLEWSHVGFYSDLTGTDHASWQVWLHEGSNIAEWHFGPSFIAPAHFAGIFGSDNGPEMAFLETYLAGFYTLEGLADSPIAIYAPGESIFLHGYPAEGMVYTFTPAAISGVGDDVRHTTPPVLYPQPVTDRLHVMGVEGNAPMPHYTLLTATGVLVCEGLLSKEGIDVSRLPSGTYMLRVSEGLRTTQHRFVRSGP